MVVTKNAPNCYTVAPTGWDTCGYSEHVAAYNRMRYQAIEPKGYLYGAHDHVAYFYMRRQFPGSLVAAAA